MILELGCGDGAVSYEVARHNPGCLFICIDFSKENIDCAKYKYSLSNIEYYQYNIFDICNFNHKFDYIYSYGVMQYFFHNDFININLSLLDILKDKGTIAHFSIPDFRKKLATIIDRYSTNNNRTIALFKSLSDILKHDIICHYERDMKSLWHSPNKISLDLKEHFFFYNYYAF